MHALTADIARRHADVVVCLEFSLSSLLFLHQSSQMTADREEQRRFAVNLEHRRRLTRPTTSSSSKYMYPTLSVSLKVFHSATGTYPPITV
jgi:hypothetical protein